MEAVPPGQWLRSTDPETINSYRQFCEHPRADTVIEFMVYDVERRECGTAVARVVNASAANEA